jgi:aminopeptidase N
MLRTDTPVTVYRKDYTPPAFAIDHVDLVLDLDPQRTVVTSTLKLQRTGAADAPLVLAGEALELVGVRLDGQPFSGVRQDGDSLTLTGLPALARWKSPRPAIPPPTPRCPACTSRTATSSPSAKPRAFAASPISWTART